MSQFQHPEQGPGGAEPWTEPPSEPNAYYGRPPTSKAAVVGLVSSLAACVPVLSPLLGLIFGIVGIRNTRAGRMSGRGLAIAAVIVAVAGAGLQGVVGIGAYFSYRVFLDSKELAEAAVAPLKSSVIRVEELGPKAYALGSARFRQRVSQEQFNDWLKEVLGKHGQLQSFVLGQPPIEKSDTAGVVSAHFVGRFVNGTTAIDFKIALTGDRPEFDDIRVEGDSPIPEDAGSP
ncbi:MAG: DUF4190 domain-containing protein [Phycisphaerae bacterium]|nr:DUF4190 domain-containing protein [Phycisphaerae bacterium]